MRGLLDEFSDYSWEEIEEALRFLSPEAVQALLNEVPAAAGTAQTPTTPLEQAQILDPHYRERIHLRYLSDRLAQAVADVENGKNRRLLVKMPPRMGKSQLTTVNFPLWLLHKHPDWKIGLISHSPNLAVSWGRQIRRVVEDRPHLLGGVQVAKDAGAVTEWETTSGGSIMSRSPGQSLAGWGFKVLLVDDPVRDFAGAHSATQREELWSWWRANALTRMEPPSLVIVVMTRWHEDDLMGRILSRDYEGDPDDWEQISFPAIAEEHDVLGRAPGEPLITPLFEETQEEALERWHSIKRDQGSYVWEALYQQRPAPAQGAIFNTDWWRFWTRDPDKVTGDGKVLLLPSDEELATGKWVDSWDMSFKGGESSDFVVGQRWVRVGPFRYLIGQQRARLGFTQSLERMQRWTDSTPSSLNPYGNLVHRRLVEEAANGAAIIEVMKEKVAGIKPVRPVVGKEGRARAVTPEIESGHVLLPLPSDPGHEWVRDELIPELQSFPTGSHDDQVDAMTQALADLRDAGQARVTVPRRSIPQRTFPNRVGLF